MIGVDTLKTIIGYRDAKILHRQILDSPQIRNAYGFGINYVTDETCDEITRICGYTSKDIKLWWLLSKMCGVKMRKKSCMCCLRCELLTICFALEELVQF